MEKSTGRLYWITGLSGAGKTTIGTALYEKLRESKNNVVIIDGDKLREAYGDAFGYGDEDRRKGALCNAKIAHILTEQGIDVVCCTISMYDSVRAWNRANNEKYTEIYLKVDMETLMKRDKKGLYSSCAENLVGVTMKMEEPKTPDVLVHNNGQEHVEDIVERILSKAKEGDGKQ
ncbi:MAG: adenylyl-sulfate kinase [Quinella sp. 1Q5]|nr:adenylyl-sulfate kinase [Quinella sp. 1Q5]